MASLVYMPLSGERTAPTFDPTSPRTLSRFFRDLEDWFARIGVTDDQEKKNYAVSYVDVTTEDLWSALDKFSSPDTYDQWKSDIVALYPGADESRRFTIPDIEDLVAHWQARGFQSIEEW